MRLSSKQGRARHNRGQVPAAEALESRALLSAVVQEFPLPPEVSPPIIAITSGPENSLWGTAGNAMEILRISTNGTFTPIPVPVPTGSGPIIEGPDGALWFLNSDILNRVTPTGTFSSFVLPAYHTSPISIGMVSDIAPGTDSNVWFTEVPFSVLHPGVPAIGKITPTGNATLITPINFGFTPDGITPGPDGNMWAVLAGQGGSEIARITPDGTFTHFPAPQGDELFGPILPGPDGQLWFTQSGPTPIGRMSTSGVYSNVPTPGITPPPFVGSLGIVSGPANSIWFFNGRLSNNPFVSQIGTVTPSGVTTLYSLPRPYLADDLTLGPDGNFWFLDSQTFSIAKIQLSSLISVNVPTLLAGAGARFSGIVANFSDASTQVAAGDFAALINYGDGQSALGTIVQTGPGAFSVIGSHVFAQATTHPISVIVANKNGGSAAGMGSATVVNGPRIIGLERIGIHNQPTQFVLGFDQPLDPIRAQNLANYVVIPVGPGARPVPLASARYIPQARAVVLTTLQPLSLLTTYAIGVVGQPPGGLGNPFGLYLDGTGHGFAGTSFVAIMRGFQILATTGMV